MQPLGGLQQDLFSATPRVRIDAAARATPAERGRILDALTVDSPYRPWPRGMPGSVNPLVAVIGVSPGNSPASSGSAFLADYTPTFGTAHSGFFYRDGSFYWDKVRSLLIEIARIWDVTLSETDTLALSTHLNLGTGMFGAATDGAIEVDVTRWVSNVLPRLKPRVVIGLGLVGLLTGANGRVRDAWNEGATRVEWLRPELLRIGGFTYRRYRPAAAPMDIVLWPNHPSRAPFAGRGGSGSEWHRSITSLTAQLAAMNPTVPVDART